ncbi:unnamed protein product, partial [marine sediment metagenome]
FYSGIFESQVFFCALSAEDIYGQDEDASRKDGDD